jgi:hypothetical protein
MILSLIIPFYDNAEMLQLQYAEWVRWSPAAKVQIGIVLVDDGSPTPAADVPRPEGLPALRIYRVLEDRPWHQHAARNLGAEVAETPWLLMTDMDHVLTVEAADALLKRLGRMDGVSIYSLHRIEAGTLEPTLADSGKPKPHPNSFVLTRDLYWHIGGYDEDYCGIYGTDGLFKERAFAIAHHQVLKQVPLIRYSREVIPDASTRTLARKEGRDPGAKAAVAAAKAARGEARVIKVLQFPWERVL